MNLRICTVTGVLGLFLVALPGCDPLLMEDGPTRIRVANDTQYDFEGLIVGTEHYGQLASWENSEYRIWDEAYEFASVSFEAEGALFELMAADFEAAEPLGPGEFTYVITIEDFEQRRISIEVETGLD